MDMTTALLNSPKPKAKPKTMSVERFAALPGLKGFELVEGRLERKGMGAKSSWNNVEMLILLRMFVKQNQLGHCFDSDCMYRCFPLRPKTIRKPDVSFVRKGRFPREQIPNGIIEIAPDFVVEVMSVHDRWTRVTRKVEEFLSAGVPVVWVVDPETMTLHVYHPDGTSIRFSGDDIVSAEPAVPGFSVKVSELFPQPVAN
jgi:Uma2 family endonuclease